MRILENDCSRSAGAFLKLLKQLQMKGKLSVTAFREVGNTLQKPRYPVAFSCGSLSRRRERDHCFMIAYKSESLSSAGLTVTSLPNVQARFWASVLFSFCWPNKLTIF